MKILIFLITAGIFSMSVIAGDGISSSKHPNKYCAKMKDGMLTVMYQGSALTSDVTLDNGTKLKTDGTIIKKDGTTVMLKEGECIDKDGQIAKEKSKKEK